MNRLLIYLGLLSLNFCSKEPLVELPSIPVIEEELKFTSIAENYSEINKSSGFYRSNEYFDNYLDKDFISTHLTTSDDHATYSTFHNNTAILDIDGDGKQDILAVTSSFCSEHLYGTHTGKIIFISDYKGDFIKKVYNGTINYPSKLEVNDFNGDGISDIILFAHNTASNYYNSTEDFGSEDRNIPPVSPKLIYYDSDINIVDVGIEACHHTGTSGDMDNDGDVDFIQFTFPSFYDTIKLKTPSILKNNNGDFHREDLIRDLNGENWFATAIDLFDVNNDGFLDLIAGWEAGDVKGENHNPNGVQGAILMYGDGSGTFALSNSTNLIDEVLRSKNYEVTILAYGFTDSDSDGDIDIILTTTRTEVGGTFEEHTYYDNYHFVLFENVDGNFVDSTNKIDISFGTDLPDFKAIKIVDVDSDGDFDIVPDRFANMSPFSYSNNIYWENIDGNYYKR